MKVLLPVLALAIALAGCPKPEASPGADSSSGAEESWESARVIAEASGASGVAKWRDDVPYLFQAKGTRGVLVHHGAVVTARGPNAAATWLRDVGVLDGKGPGPDGLLTLLYVLEAFPKVDGLPEQSAIDTLGPPELQPKIERANGRATVVLHYSLPNDPGPSRGTRKVRREKLEIGPTGDVAWSGETLEIPAR